MTKLTPAQEAAMALLGERWFVFGLNMGPVLRSLVRLGLAEVLPSKRPDSMLQARLTPAGKDYLEEKE